MVAVLGFNEEQIRSAVQDMYTIVANRPDSPLHFLIGREAALNVGYDEFLIAGLPDQAIESFAGVGNPHRADIIRPGMMVLDVGSGSGTDVLIASQQVGNDGKVYALDMTEAMRNKLKNTLQQHDIHNVEIVAGDAEHIPLRDASVDVVTSNGVLNLVLNKRKAIAEIFRVLKPSGQVQIADIVIAKPVTPDCEDDPRMWAECVVGATIDESYLEMFRDAGFEQVEILRDYDYFAFSPSKDTREIAGQFGAHAYELRLQRAQQAPAKAVQWIRRLDPRRAIRNIQRRGLWGTVSLVLAMASCYGTLAAVTFLSLLGVNLAINEGVWTGAILLFAALATVMIAFGLRKHRDIKPLLGAITGVTLLGYAMLVNYHIAIEIAGFVALTLATWLDYRLRRWADVNPPRRHKAQQSSGTSTTGVAR